MGNILMGIAKAIYLEAKGTQGGYFIHSTLAFSRQSLENPLEVTDASAGNR
jgi:hypothetical protein